MRLFVKIRKELEVDYPISVLYDAPTIERFADVVNRAGYASPIRTPRGRDIFAACGQLKSASERLPKSERMQMEAAQAGTTSPL